VAVEHSGHRRVWSFSAALEALVLAELTRKRVLGKPFTRSFDAVRRKLSYYRDPIEARGKVLVVSQKRGCIVIPDAHLAGIAADTEGWVAVVDLGELAARLVSEEAPCSKR